MGGSDDDDGGVRLDGAGNLYLIGRTRSLDFPTANAFQPTNHGDFDIFVAKLISVAPQLSVTSPADGSSFLSGSTVLVTGYGSAPVTVNGKPVETMDTAGDFFTRVLVRPGQNTFNFVATDNFG